MSRPRSARARVRSVWSGLAAIAAAIAILIALDACTSGSNKKAVSATSAQPSELQNKPLGQFNGFGLDPPQPRPSFVLKDATNADYDFGARTAGRPTLVFFGYTHCPDECPTTMADIRLALTEVPAAVRSKMLVIFVSTDPKRDTGPVIKKWLAQYAVGLSPEQFVGLHGTQVQIDAAQAASHITIAEDNGETHSTVVLLFGPDNYAHVSFVLSDTEREQMVHDLPIVAAM